MKKILLLLFISVSTILTAQNKVTKVTYKQALVDEKTQEIKELKGIEYYLYANNHSSYFETKEFEDEYLKVRNAVYTRFGKGGDNPIYKNLSTGEKFINYQSRSGSFLVFRKFTDDWEITKETKKINNYKCIKAKGTFLNDLTGETFYYYAWFTPEITLPFGPKGYDGLPGLVLELELGKSIIYTTGIDFNYEYNIEKPNLKEVTIEEYRAIRGTTEYYEATKNKFRKKKAKKK